MKKYFKQFVSKINELSLPSFPCHITCLNLETFMKSCSFESFMEVLCSPHPLEKRVCANVASKFETELCLKLLLLLAFYSNCFL